MIVDDRWLLGQAMITQPGTHTAAEVTVDDRWLLGQAMITQPGAHTAVQVPGHCFIISPEVIKVWIILQLSTSCSLYGGVSVT